MNSKLRRFLVALAALGAWCTSPHSRAVAQTPAPAHRVVLSAAPSQGTFALGQTVAIKVTLTNRGAGAVALSDLIDGNFRITAITRNSFSIGAHRSAADFDEDLGFSLKQSLKSFAPGAAMTTLWESGPTSATTGEAIQAVLFSTSGHQVLTYDIDAPGTYKVTFHYQYPGPTAGVANVFTGKTNSVTVTFNVV